MNMFAPAGDFKHALDEEIRPKVCQLASSDSPLMYIKALFFLSWALLSYIALLQSESALQGGFFALSLTLAAAAIAFNIQHDGNHGSFSRRNSVNRLAGFCLDILGASSYFWRNKHNHNHHVFTNVPGLDADIELGRLARLSEDHPWLWYHKYQHWYLWLLYCGVHLRYLYSDVQRIVFNKRDGAGVPFPRGTDLWTMLLGKALFVTLAFVIPCLVFEWYVVACFYAGMSMCMGFILSVVFQLAHSVDIVQHPRLGSGQPVEWTVHQLQTTANFATNSRLVTLLCGGLNFQREHHLFPKLSHVHYPLIERRVRELCRQRGLPCHENRSLAAALRSHYRFIRQMGRKPVSC